MKELILSETQNVSSIDLRTLKEKFPFFTAVKGGNVFITEGSPLPDMAFRRCKFIFISSQKMDEYVLNTPVGEWVSLSFVYNPSIKLESKLDNFKSRQRFMNSISNFYKMETTKIYVPHLVVPQSGIRVSFDGLGYDFPPQQQDFDLSKVRVRIHERSKLEDAGRFPLTELIKENHINNTIKLKNMVRELTKDD